MGGPDFWRKKRMKIIRSVDKNGATTERIELSGGEKAAIERAHKSVAERCAESGVGYGPE